MPTVKQQQAFEKVVENGGNVSRAMIDVNYSPNTAKTPQKLTESKGWKELCDEHGLTEDFLVNALVDDIREKPKNRKAELELGFKVIGKLSEKQEGNKTLILIVSGESASRYNVQPNRNTEGSSLRPA